MANMGYCRFTNTGKDVESCIEAIKNNDVSAGEREEAIEMFTSILELCEDYGIIEEYDSEALVDIIDDSLAN